MALMGSQKYPLKPEYCDHIINSVKLTGHCVLEQVWDVTFLDKVFSVADRFFEAKDQVWYLGKMPSGELNQYFGSFYDVFDNHLNDDFFDCIATSALPMLFTVMLQGRFAIMKNERAVRRVDPKFPVRLSGFHVDGQLSKLSSQGFHTQDEYTVWSPLVDVMDDCTPRLMLIDRNDHASFLALYDSIVIDLGAKKNIPILGLSKLNLDLEKKFLKEILVARENAYAAVVEKQKCYAPKLKKGDAIIFDKNIWHSSFIPPFFENKRLSLDFRIVGDHTPTTDEGWDGRFFSYKNRFLSKKKLIMEKYR
ncbi:MAG: hypothetical protein A3F10_06340 [Coxiella sp. RIFCSPHIGHO2_12_FULL_42_15]|nr:MAG: hypothetical protein A3F10_06340 [Coxiella sp. RIFCSPHIGHO2_12_FULL_42_15]